MGNPAPPSNRIGVLDVLRGIALLGMFFVHFHDRSTDPGGGFGHGYGRFVELFFAERFYTIFGILFGVGFAVQLRRAEARGDDIIPRYIRRLLALAVFGFIAEGFFGFNVLVGYAIWGFPLLLVRRWSNRALAILLLVCAASGQLYDLGRATWLTATGRAGQWDALRTADLERYRAANHAFDVATDSTDYGTVVMARIRHMKVFYSRPFSFLPFLSFTLFLIGMLALRLGLFEEPGRHRRLIIGWMVFGVAAWAAAEWLFPLKVTPPPGAPLPLRVLIEAMTQSRFFALFREMWLSFTYIGAILLLVARDPAWLRRLGAFGITGRMALTNYMVQVAIIDLIFSNYGLGLKIGAGYAPLAALALFAVDVGLCRWWLARYRYGPMEWLWRSITYAEWQPIRRLAEGLSVT